MSAVDQYLAATTQKPAPSAGGSATDKYLSNVTTAAPAPKAQVSGGRFTTVVPNTAPAPLVPFSAPAPAASAPQFEQTYGKASINPAQMIVDIAQATPRAASSIALSANKLVGGTGTLNVPTKESGASKAEIAVYNTLFGQKPVKDVRTTGEELATTFGASPETAKKYGLVIGIGSTVLDLLPPTKEASLVKDIALSKDVNFITKTLQDLKIAPSEVERLAPLLKKANSPEVVREILKTARTAEQDATALANEARKYKTPEEFIKSRPESEEIKRIADNLQKNNPGISRRDLEAMAKDVYNNSPRTSSQLTKIWNDAKSGFQEAERAATVDQQITKTTRPSQLLEEGLPQQAGKVDEASQRISSLGKDLENLKTNLDINTKHYNISSLGKQVIEKTIEDVKPAIEASVGARLSNKEAYALAQQSSKILDKVVPRAQTLEWEAAMIKTREVLAHAAQEGKVTQEFVDALATVKTMGTDIARKLQSLSIDVNPTAPNAMQSILEAILKVTDNADKVIEAAKGVDFNDFNQAAQFYRQFVKPTAGEWIDLVRYNSMLSSPVTHIVNVFSNVVNSGVIAPLEKAVAGGLDFLKATFTGSDRALFAGEGGAYLKGYISSVKDAFKRFGDVMAGRRAISQLDLKGILPAVEGTKGTIAKVLARPMQLLEAADQFFSALTEGGEKAALSLRESKGVPVALKELQAQEKAAYRLFRQKPGAKGQGYVLEAIDAFTNGIARLRNHPNPIVSTVAKFTVPFLQTPMNIFKQGIEYSPLGFATALGNANKIEQFAKAGIGTGFAMTAGMLIASNRMTFDEPVNTAQKNAFRAAGMQPYSVKIGNTWYSYQKLAPAIAYPLAMVAAIHWAAQNKGPNDDFVDAALKGMAKYGQFLADQSYAKSIGDLITAVQGGEAGIAKLISNYPQQLIPFRALSGWFARLVDEYQRQVDSGAGFVDKQMQNLFLNIPFLSETVPLRVDKAGNPIEQPHRFINAFSPIKVSEGNAQLEQFLNQQFELNKALKTATDTRSAIRDQVQPIYDQAQQLKSEGKTDEAQALIDGLTDEQYTAYKAIKSSETAKNSNTLKIQVFPKYQEIQQLNTDGNAAQAKALLDGLSDDEYKAYQSIKKSLQDNNVSPDAVAKIKNGQPKSEPGFLNTVFTYAKAIGTDPITAFNRIFTGQRILRLSNNAIIVERLPLSASSKIKQDLGSTTEMRLDHTIPLELGGSNSKSNLKLVPVDQWRSYTPVENYLGQLLSSGKIDRQQAQDTIVKFKNGDITAEEALKLF